MASASTIRAARAFVELFADTTKLQQGLRQAENMLKEFSTRATTLGRTVTAAGGIMIAPIAASIKTFYQFDDNMREVQAVTKATGKEFDTLTEKAKKLGRETSFTAIQVSQAMGTLGRAGFKTKEIDDSIASILTLARSTRTDLNDAAKIASIAMRGFVLEASDMEHVVDVLATVSNGAALNLTDFGESLKYVAPVAQQAGMSIEDAAGAIGVLSNFGIKGTMAGTALKNILTRMVNPDVVKKFQALGIATKDAEGDMRSLLDVLYDIAEKTKHMGTGERMEIFKNLADLRALPAFAVMANNPEKITEMIDELRASMGNAAEMSALMDAGLGGSFRMFISAVESASIALAETVTGPLQQWMERMKEAVNVFNAWTKVNAKSVVLYAKIGVGIIGLGGALYVVGKAAQVASSTFALFRGALRGVAGGFQLVTNALMDYSGTSKLVAAQQAAAQKEIGAQRYLGQVQAQLNQAMLVEQDYAQKLKNYTQGTKAYTKAQDKLTEAHRKTEVITKRLATAQKEYTAAQREAAAAKKAIGGGTPGGLAFTVMRGTYHRLGGDITNMTNWFAGKKVFNELALAMEAVGRTAKSVGRAIVSPFTAAVNIWQTTAKTFVSIWTGAVNQIVRVFSGMGKGFSLANLKNAFSQLGGVIRRLNLAALSGWIRSVGLAAKAASVGVGTLRVTLNGLNKMAGGIAGMAASMLAMSSIFKIINANISETKTDKFESAVTAGAQLDSTSESLQRYMRQLMQLNEVQKNTPLSDDAFERAKFLIDQLNDSVMGLGLTYDELTKTIKVADDAQSKLNEKLKQDKINNLQTQLSAKNAEIEELDEQRKTFDKVVHGDMGFFEKRLTALSFGATQKSRIYWKTAFISDKTRNEMVKENQEARKVKVGEAKQIQRELDELRGTNKQPGETEEDFKEQFVDKANARFGSSEFSAEENPVDALLKGSGAMSGIDSNLSPAEKIKAINEKLKKDTEAVRGEMDKITEEFAATIGEAPDTVLGDFLKKLPEMMRKTPEEFRTFLEETRNAIIDRRNELGEAFKKGEITQEDYTKAIGQLGGANAALPGFERYYQLGGLAGVTLPSHKEITEGKSLAEVVGLSGIHQGYFGLTEYDVENGDVIPIAESNKIISFKDFKPSEQYQTYEDYIKAVSKKMIENPEAFYKEELGHFLNPDEDTIQDIRKLGEVLPQMVNVQTILGETIEGSLSKAAKQQIDEIAKEQIAGIEEYTRPMESERQAELRRSAEEYQKQYDNVEGIAAALQASGKTITYGDLTADGSNLITLKQILDMQREERDAEINEKYDKEVADGIAEAMRASGASAIDVARVAYGEDTSGAVPQADVSKFENAIAEADRAFNAGEISEYESDVAKYNALVGERDALLNSGDLKFLGKKLEDAQEVYKQALEAYEQENSDENAKALQEAAQALNDISDEYEGAYDTMLGSIDDALQDLENKSYQEENENAGFERAKVEYGSRGSFSAYEGSSLGESQIDIRIEKNTAETVTLLRDTFHWWKQMYEPQAVFA